MVGVEWQQIANYKVTKLPNEFESWKKYDAIIQLIKAVIASSNKDYKSTIQFATEAVDRAKVNPTESNQLLINFAETIIAVNNPTPQLKLTKLIK